MCPVVLTFGKMFRAVLVWRLSLLEIDRCFLSEVEMPFRFLYSISHHDRRRYIEQPNSNRCTWNNHYSTSSDMLKSTM